MKTVTITIAAALVLLVLALIAAVSFGGPKPISPLASINDAFNNVDFSDVPVAQRFIARDGTSLAWLHYPAAGKRQDLFDRYLLLSPYLHRTAPVNRVIEDNWVSIGLPRAIALRLLNRVGISAWNHLPVLRFGLDDAIKGQLTSSYSYTLTLAFAPHDDYRADIRGSHQPMRIVAGSEDELFDGNRYAGVFSDAGKPVTVTLVQGVNHMGLTLDPLAMPAIIDAAGK